MNAHEPPVRRNRLMRCRSLGIPGRIERVFLDADGDVAAVTLEAQGGGWITATPADLVPLNTQDLN